MSLSVILLFVFLVATSLTAAGNIVASFWEESTDRHANAGRRAPSWQYSSGVQPQRRKHLLRSGLFERSFSQQD